MEGIRRWLRGTIALICIVGIGSCGYEPLDPPSIAVEQQPLETLPRACSQENAFGEAVGKASSASGLAQTARSREEWQTVVLYWMQAIERMQAVKGDDPKWAFAQKKVAEYQHYLTIAKQQANRLPQSLPFTSFKSQIFDEKLWLFLSYRAALQTPDILIVGSSRALQGVDPIALEKNLIARGHEGIKAFNLGINGSTAKVVDVLVREILTPEQLPDLIIWADGVRAFNSGREDLTDNAIASSSGYQELLRGKRPTLPAASAAHSQTCSSRQGILPSIPKLGGWLGGELPAIAAGVGEIDANGFLAISRRFDRDRYYQQFPDVPGLYDADYQNFTLVGEQTEALERLQNYLQQRQIPLVFVNLPVTGDYLDETRQGRERQFRTFMTEQGQKQGFTFIDLGEQWRERLEYFADPSHLNRYGAVLVGEQLANNPALPYMRTKKPDAVLPALETTPTQPRESETLILPTPPLD
ncbi:MAG: hypothetical protein J7647_02660 [Cyanobacteria bacterium SBLK]|nr:hypothetical protein [Cyanobacteria bacterium SBLK]